MKRSFEEEGEGSKRIRVSSQGEGAHEEDRIESIAEEEGEHRYEKQRIERLEKEFYEEQQRIEDEITEEKQRSNLKEERFEKELYEKQQRLEDEIKEKTQRLEDEITEEKQRIDLKEERFEKELYEKQQRLEDEIKEKTQRIEDEITEEKQRSNLKEERLEKELYEKQQRLEDEIKEKTQRLEDEITEEKQRIDLKEERFEKELYEKQQRLEDEIKEKTQRLEDEIKEKTQRLEDEITEEKQRIDLKEERLEKELYEKQQRLEDEIKEDKQRIDLKEERLEKEFFEEQQRIDAEEQGILDLESRVVREEGHDEAKVKTLLLQWQELRQQSSFAERRQALDKRRRDFAAEFDERRRALAAEINERRRALDAEVDERRRVLAADGHVFAAEVDKRRRALAAEVDERRRALAAEADERRRVLAADGHVFAAEVDKRRRALAAEADERRRALAAEVDERRRALAAEFDERRRDLAAEVDEHRRALEEAGKVTKNYQGSASSFQKPKANPPQGFGFLLLCTYFRPGYFEGRGLYKLIPTDEDIRDAPQISELYGEQLPLRSWQESVNGGVQDQMDVLAKTGRFPGLKAHPQLAAFSARGLHGGIASMGSKEDNTISMGGFFLGCIENKGDGDVVAAISQSAIGATNYAMSLLSHGISREKCIVPVIGHCATIMHFGVTAILDDSFPTYIPLSKQLDMLNPTDRSVASAFLKKACDHCTNLHKQLEERTMKEVHEVEMKLATRKSYFIKKLTASVLDRGLGMFGISQRMGDSGGRDIVYLGGLGRGLFHMWRALNMVYKSRNARNIAEYPLSIRTPDSEDDCYYLIYRNLNELGYRIGTPHRIDHPDLYKRFFEALTKAVGFVHDAGVIHVDLYASNVMWKASNNEVDIKIIDWDGAHVLAEGDFHQEVKSRLQLKLRGLVRFGVHHDLLYISALDVDEDIVGHKAWARLWDNLASNDKALVDEAFNLLLERKLDQLCVGSV